MFPAGADAASATAICADSRLPAGEIEPLLASLVDKSLLQTEVLARPSPGRGALSDAGDDP